MSDLDSISNRSSTLQNQTLSLRSWKAPWEIPGGRMKTKSWRFGPSVFSQQKENWTHAARLSALCALWQGWSSSSRWCSSSCWECNHFTYWTQNVGCPLLQLLPPCLSPSTFTGNMDRNALQCFCKLKHRLQIITWSSMKKIENVQWRWRGLNSRRRLWRRRNVLIESIMDCIVLNWTIIVISRVLVIIVNQCWYKRACQISEVSIKSQ